jgi:kynurenine formamidase
MNKSSITGKIEVLDLSRPITDGMYHFSGDPVPEVKTFSTIDEKGWALTQFTLGSHSGTHVDAPSHAVKGGATIDTLPLEKFFGEAIVLDLSYKKPDESITAKDLEKAANDRIRPSDIVLILTGMASHWGKEEYLTKYPYLTEDAAKWLVNSKVKLVGIDWLTVEKFGSKEGLAHHALLEKGIPIVENLVNLEKIKDERVLFACFPLRLAGVDGAPTRAVAIKTKKR